MKLAFVTTNLRGGGAEKAVVKLASALSARGHEVHLLLLENLIEHPIDGSFQVHALSRPGKSVSKGYLGKRLAAWRLARLYRGLERDASFDMTVATLPFADEVVALARLPRVWHRIANTLSAEVAALQQQNPRKAARRLARYRELYEGRNLIAVSEGVAEDLREQLQLPRANIVRIYNLYDMAGIRRLAEAHDAKIPQQAYVLHVGRFVRQKRHDLLFAAFKTLPPSFKLVLLTHPNAALDDMLTAAGIKERTIVAGFRQNPYPWMRHAALLVLCSDHEGLPNVLIESLICGTSVVSTDCPSGPREILEGALRRFLVPCGDPAALARAMQAALDTKPDLSEQTFAKFAAETVLHQYEALPQRWRQPA